MNLLSSIPNDIAIVTGQKKNLFIAETINENTCNRVRVRRVDSLPNDARFGWMQGKLRFARYVLIGKAGLVDMNHIDAGEKVEIVPMRECRQVTTPSSQTRWFDVLGKLFLVSGRLGKSITQLNGSLTRFSPR
jgi:hypothetical protein